MCTMTKSKHVNIEDQKIKQLGEMKNNHAHIDNCKERSRESRIKSPHNIKNYNEHSPPKFSAALERLKKSNNFWNNFFIKTSFILINFSYKGERM